MCIPRCCRRKARNDDSDSDSDSDKSNTESLNKRRKKASYKRFFERRSSKVSPKPTEVSATLSQTSNEKVMNIIDLPATLPPRPHDKKNVTANTPRQFAEAMGYVQKQRLGKGGFGEVFLVERLTIDETSGEPVKHQMACKNIVLESERKDKLAKAMQSLKTELFMMQKLSGQCPFVVKYIEHYVLCYKPYTERRKMCMHAAIYMEYADGGCLDNDVRKQRGLDQALAKRYFLEMATGLEFMHRKKIAHNDFKLQNVLLVKSVNRPDVKHCKLTDFGMSQFAWKESIGLVRPTKARGTMSYMSPELLTCWAANDGKHDYEPFKADIWALGVSLYMMLNCLYPYESPDSEKDPGYQNLLTQLEASCVTRDIKKKFKSAKLIDLLTGMLEYDADRRFTIFMVTKHPWLE